MAFRTKVDNSAAGLAARHAEALGTHEQTVNESTARYEGTRQEIIETAVEQVRAVRVLKDELDAQEMGLTTLIREELGADINTPDSEPLVVVGVEPTA